MRFGSRPDRGRRGMNVKIDTVPKLKRKLDAAMSKWVRLNYSTDGETVPCFTCGVVKPIKEMHSGHYIPRTQSPTRYDERNQRPQCPGCNTFRSGMPHEFRHRLCMEIGEDEVKDLEQLARHSWKWDRQWLMDKIEYYKTELKELEAA